MLFFCPNCGLPHQIPAGITVNCSTCGQSFSTPQFQTVLPQLKNRIHHKSHKFANLIRKISLLFSLIGITTAIYAFTQQNPEFLLIGKGIIVMGFVVFWVSTVARYLD